MSKPKLTVQKDMPSKGRMALATLDFGEDTLADYGDEFSKQLHFHLTEADAMRLVGELITSFNIVEGNIEVLHFPLDKKKSDVLIEAAARLDHQDLSTKVIAPTFRLKD